MISIDLEQRIEALEAAIEIAKAGIRAFLAYENNKSNIEHFQMVLAVMEIAEKAAK